MIFKPKETNTMCLSTKLNLAEKNYWKMVDGKWIRWNQMGTQWSIEKVDKTESDLGVDYKGEYKSTFSQLN